MKLSVSNIAWGAEDDTKMYNLLASMGYTGLEIAPTRLFGDKPYEKAEDVRAFSRELGRNHGLRICSMQSIWYGREEPIFKGVPERETLLSYSRKAAEFAKACGCSNLVFGNPKNRTIGSEADLKTALAFFRELGSIAEDCGVIFALEPNPRIYGTNFLNRTKEAADFVRLVDSPGIRMNVDFGTILDNSEDLEDVAANIDIVNHVHISEPNLLPIRESDGHRELAGILKDADYKGFVSIEMRRQPSLDPVMGAIDYVAAIFR